MKFKCSKCGDLKKALVDGYRIGDTLLEDVYFEVTIEKNQLHVEVEKSARGYFKQFNEKLWYDKCKEEARNDCAECPYCHKEVQFIP